MDKHYPTNWLSQVMGKSQGGGQHCVPNPHACPGRPSDADRAALWARAGRRGRGQHATLLPLREQRGARKPLRVRQPPVPRERQPHDAPVSELRRGPCRLSPVKCNVELF